MAKTTLRVDAPAGNPNTIMFYLGMLFVVLGVLFGVGGIIAAVVSKEWAALLFGIPFLAIFGGIGGFFAKIGYDGLHANDRILNDGASYLGKIYGYDSDYRVMMNGQPCVVLVVRYMASGQIRECRVTTGDVNMANYPRGATVAIKIDEGVAALVPGSVSDMHIEQEDDLLNPDFDPTGQMSSINVSCPHCGASVVVPLGMSRFCPYCNSKISITADGRLIS